MKKIDPKHNRAAFTLIEVIVAIGIFGIGVIAIIGYYAVSVQASRNSRQLTTATFLAQGLIETNISESYDALTPGTGTKQAFTTNPADPAYPYQREVDISLIDQNLAVCATDVGLKKIDVYTFWQSPTGEKKVQLSTIIAKR